MHYRVSSRYEYCVAGGRTILLDLQLNRYFGLTPGDEVRLHEILLRNCAVDEVDPRLMGLVRRGLVEVAADFEPLCRPVICDPVMSDLGNMDGVVPSALHVLQAMLWQLRWDFTLRTTRFAVVIDRLRKAEFQRRLPDEEQEWRARRTAAAFERSSYMLARADRCLVRSLAMMSLLRASGISADFVIGVRSEPFFAHSWVQRHGTVLNDIAEHAWQFTPIMVV